MPWVWADRNWRQVGPDRRGAGSSPAFFMIFQTVEAATVCVRGRPARPGCVCTPTADSRGPSSAPGPGSAVRWVAGLVVGAVGPAAGDELGVPAQQRAG